MEGLNQNVSAFNVTILKTERTFYWSCHFITLFAMKYTGCSQRMHNHKRLNSIYPWALESKVKRYLLGTRDSFTYYCELFSRCFKHFYWRVWWLSITVSDMVFPLKPLPSLMRGWWNNLSCSAAAGFFCDEKRSFVGCSFFLFFGYTSQLVVACRAWPLRLCLVSRSWCPGEPIVGGMYSQAVFSFLCLNPDDMWSACGAGCGGWVGWVAASGRWLPLLFYLFCVTECYRSVPHLFTVSRTNR